MEEWLLASGVPSINAINEDFYETDYRDDTSFPPLRTSGLDVQVTIEFDNRDPVTKYPDFHSTEVFATVKCVATADMWAGPGPRIHYNQYPTGVAGNQTYDKVLLYQYVRRRRARPPARRSAAARPPPRPRPAVPA